MLGGLKLKLVFTHEKTCFAYISSKYNTSNDQSHCVQLLYKDKRLLLWTVSSMSVPEGHIACNPTHCRLLGLQEGCDVFVSPYNDVKVLDELYIDADSSDDQEILEHNAMLLQNRILDQLRLVAANQKAVVWISVSMPIVFTPKQTGLLVNDSKIMVKVNAFNNINSSPQNKTTNVPKNIDNIKFKNIGLVHKNMLMPYLAAPKKLVLRAVPIDGDGKKNLVHPYTVFMHEDLLEGKYKELTVILGTMQSIPSMIRDTTEEDDGNSNNQINDLCVEVVLIDNIVFRSLCREVYNRNIPTVLIPKSLNSIINVENGMKIIITIIGDEVDQPEHIDIVTYSEQSQNDADVIERFKTCVIENTHSGKKFLINNAMIKQNQQITEGFVQFKLTPEKLKYTLLHSESFRNCTVAAKCLKDTDLELPKLTASNLDYDSKNYCRSMRSTQELIDKVLLHLYFEIHREANFKGVSEIKSNVLVTGLSGTGKSSICHIVQKELTVWSHILQCRPLKGRKDIPEVLGKAILMCQEHSPAVLICDDVDSLIPPNIEGTSPQDAAYYQRLAVVVKHQLQTCSGVSVLLTATTMQALHPTLRQFGGRPLYTAHFDIQELEQDERAELLKHLLNDRIREQFHVEDEDVVKMSTDTAGHTARDVIDYLNQKIFKAVKKKRVHPEEPKPRLVVDVTKDVEKANAFDIWGPVGGLDDVKQQLTEAIFWPLMYPALFPSQSCGVLLYGPPGTGKSHVGSCLARLEDVTMITVKGPELLSKYIGQSEKAVRDVFDRADMKRPSILFFDEFDSLAPKRGHDSTGVTDRVVNQLLARLDGAEGSARGAVVAATSRPDLIDPALLRAGRLQRHLYCALPDLRGRHEVLRTLVKSVAVDDKVDLEELAARTGGFSPADLKSLLVTAQLARLEAQLMQSADRSVEAVVVRREDVESALAETRPSLSADQRRFYDMIYRRFRGEPLTAEQRSMASNFQKQRVTLA